MKKALFVVFAVLMLSFAAVSAQETQTVTEVNWSDLEPALGELLNDGKFYSVADLGLQMWIPSVLTEQELNEEEIESGDISYLTDEENTVGVNISYMDMEGATLDDMVAYFNEAEGYADVEKVILNGLEAISLTDTVNETMLVGFMTEKGYLIQFMFFPTSNEDFKQVASVMAASIQPE